MDFVTYENDIAFSERISSMGCSVIKVPHLKAEPLAYCKAVYNLLKSGKYECVYVNMLSAANALPVFLAKRTGVSRIALHAHADNTVGILRRILHGVNRKYCSRKADLRLACGSEAGKWLFGDDAFTVIPNAIDCYKYRFSAQNRVYFRKKYGIPENSLVIGHVGRFAPEKNHEFILGVFRELKKTVPDSVLMLAGDGPLRKSIEDRASELELNDSVFFCGTVDNAESLYSAFDVFLFPSSFEGFGLAALEAQACGCRVFCSDTLSPELNVSGSVIYLPLKDEPRVWAEEIRKSADLDRTALNKSVVESEYNIEKQRERLVRLLNE